jgi:hypothetical protein
MNKDILKTNKTEFNELWKEKKIYLIVGINIYAKRDGSTSGR